MWLLSFIFDILSLVWLSSPKSDKGRPPRLVGRFPPAGLGKTKGRQPRPALARRWDVALSFLDGRSPAWFWSSLPQSSWFEWGTPEFFFWKETRQWEGGGRVNLRNCKGGEISCWIKDRWLRLYMCVRQHKVSSRTLYASYYLGVQTESFVDSSPSQPRTGVYIPPRPFPSYKTSIISS